MFLELWVDRIKKGFIETYTAQPNAQNVIKMIGCTMVYLVAMPIALGATAVSGIGGIAIALGATYACEGIGKAINAIADGAGPVLEKIWDYSFNKGISQVKRIADIKKLF
jgi:hypothetical protein